MVEVKSYRFKKKPPDLISKFKVIKEDWYDFVKYMSDLRNMYKCPLQMNGHCKDIHGEDHIITVSKKAIYENIHDVMKIKEWNNDIEFDDHPICKDSSSDSCSHSEESGSVYNFNKYKIIHNNIYSNNANLKRQKVHANYRSICIPREKREVKEEKKKYSHEICYKRRTRKKNILNSSCNNDELNNKNNKLAKNDAAAPNEQCDLYHKKILRRSLTKLSRNIFYPKSKSSAYISYPDEYDYTYGWKEYDVSYDPNEYDLESNEFVDTNESRKYNKLRKCTYKEKVDSGKKDKRRKRQYFNNDEFSRSNSLSNLSAHDNISANDVPKEKKNNIFVKKNNKYEVYSNAVNKAHKDDSQMVSKHSKKDAQFDEAVQNNPHFDGSYAYNFAYMDKNDRSGGSTPVEAVHGTIMNLDEEIRNYNFRRHK
ncbi:conserved Plasmodium protein, unknown function [Plasmodium vivax]|uniref:Uncharacterized protein n=2 Tax=Plasmodium vivax TaxID=5855 RepID=A5K949_PLAVS|nr:hypothetical protein, conserved [Plasmodium vivax]EDL43921.1 hypothetical protein, conserved [Plasmodium vivax]SCO73030.1 conserved Plasmodium protein, unknown function [Plasmodium vivax]VUZ96320.1 conserved Plasmodium protein, unknown function [Plasmodium vivax]|eukprot:XP_001613648.1 hypothetical protein [Plasmodium vivax Sal-1]